MTAPAKARKGRPPSQGKRLLEEAWSVALPGTGAGYVPLQQMYRQDVAFYDGSTPERTLVTCPDCRTAADPVFGHGGQCIGQSSPAIPGSGLAVIRHLALEQAVITLADLTAGNHDHGVHPHRAAAALAQAEHRAWIEPTVTGWRSLIVGQRLQERPR